MNNNNRRNDIIFIVDAHSILLFICDQVVRLVLLLFFELQKFPQPSYFEIVCVWVCICVCARNRLQSLQIHYGIKIHANYII